MCRLCRQTSVNRGHAFGQAEHVVYDRVADFAVEVAEFGFAVAVNRDAERGDAVEAGLGGSLPGVFSGGAGGGGVLAVGGTGGGGGEEAGARALFHAPARGGARG